MAVQHAFGDGVLVQGVVQNADGVAVPLPEVGMEIHSGGTVVGGGEVDVLVAVLAPERVRILGVQPRQIRFPGLEHEGLGAFDGDGLVDDPVDVRHLAVVVLVFFQNDHAAGGVPFHELVTPGAHGVLVGGGGVDVLAREQVLGQDADGEVVQHGGVGLGQGEDHGLGVRRRD